jgi:nucleoside phosphorylase
MQPSDLKGKVDFGIITIREDEFEAVLQRFPDRLGLVSGRRQYNLRRLAIGDGGEYTVAIVRCAAQGNGEAQQVANALLEELAPRWLLVVGIAGGAPAFEFTLGDVVVSTEVCDFNVGAVLKDGSHEYALQGWVTHPDARKHAVNLGAIEKELGAWSSAASIGAARPAVQVPPKGLYGDADWKKKVKNVVERHFGGAPRTPKVVAGALACSDLVMKDAELFQVWLKDTRQVIAVEMESAGIHRAAHERQVPVLSIRGISDVVGLPRSPAWTGYACHSAASFARAFLLTVPIVPQAKTAQPVMRQVPSRAQLVRDILNELKPARSVGVAVVGPRGFGARAVVDEVLARLDQPEERLLPVRFIPELRTIGEERLYGTLLRDLRRALPETWRQVVDARKEASAMDRFEYAVEDLLDGPVKESGRELLFVIESLVRVSAEQLEQWGFLLARLSGRGLKLLAWGGQTLHELRTQPPANGRFSAFHLLREVRLGALSRDDVERLVVERGGGGAAARVLHEETGGHPALVNELLERYAEESLAGDRDAIAARIRDGESLDQLWRDVEGEPALQEMLRRFAAMAGTPLARGSKRGEVRLEWLGILKDAGARNWDWVAPAMQRFAGKWS